MSGSEVADLVKAVGIPVAVLVVVLYLVIRGFLRTRQELDEVKQQRDDAIEQRNWYRDRLDRSLSVQEQTVPVVKEAVAHRQPDLSDLDKLAQVIDDARQRGLIT